MATPDDPTKPERENNGLGLDDLRVLLKLASKTAPSAVADLSYLQELLTGPRAKDVMELISTDPQFKERGNPLLLAQSLTPTLSAFVQSIHELRYELYLRFTEQKMPEMEGLKTGLLAALAGHEPFKKTSELLEFLMNYFIERKDLRLSFTSENIVSPEPLPNVKLKIGDDDYFIYFKVNHLGEITMHIAKKMDTAKKADAR